MTDRFNETQPVEVDNVPEGENESQDDTKEYWVKGPWHLDTIEGGDLFPTITPQGVKMTGAQKAEAKKAADQLHVRLLVKEA